jgi:ribosomal protein L44E
MNTFIWSDCSDRVRHAFRVDENGRNERVSACGEIYHPVVTPVKKTLQLALPLVCPMCKKMEQREQKLEHPQLVAREVLLDPEYGFIPVVGEIVADDLLGNKVRFYTNGDDND